MPQVNIEGVGKVNFPDDYSPERIQFAIENDILPRVKVAKPKDFAKPEAPNALERFGRGMADVSEGVQQGSGMLLDALPAGAQQALKANPLTSGSMALAKLFAPEDTSAFTKQKTEENALYERGRSAKGDPGIDWMRLGGNAVATLPVAAIPGGAATSLPLRMLSGATQGAAASGSMFTPDGESKAEQTATGAVVGGLLPAVGAGLKKGGGAVLEKLGLGKALEVPSAGTISGEIALKLEQKGIDFKKLTAEVQGSLVSDAQKALSTGGTLDEAMLANKALIESVGAKGTRASITRLPEDWQREQHLRQAKEVAGIPLTRRAEEDAAALTTYLGKVRAGTGGKTSDAYGTAESVIGAVKTADAEKEKAADALWNAFRASGEQDTNVPAAKVADAMGKVADEIGHENIPPAVMSRLKEFGFAGEKQTKAFTVNEADKLNRLINNNNPGHGPASTALGRIKSAVNDAMLDVEPAGQRGVEALKEARAASAKLFKEREAAKGITAAVDDVAPDRFVKKYIIDADARDVRGLWDELGKSAQGKQAQADVKGHVIDGMLLRATSSKTLEDVAGQPFSYARFADALNAIPREKLHTMFSPSEVENLRTLEKASRLLTQEVPFSDVNHSKTTAALANILQRVGNTPVLGQIVAPIIGAGKIGADWVKNANDRKIVADAILGSAAKAGPKSLPKAGAERFLVGPAAATFSQPSYGTDK